MLELEAAEGVAQGAEVLLFSAASVSAARGIVSVAAVVVAIASSVGMATASTVFFVGCAFGGGASVDFNYTLEAETDAFAGDVDFGDGGADFLADFDDFVRVFDEAVGELGDVGEAVLVDADVDEGAEGGNVGHDAGELHAFGEVGDGVNAFLEFDELEFGAGVASGLGELLHDVLQGWKADFFCSVLLDIDLLASGGAAH